MSRLPNGFKVGLRADTRILDGGRFLVGGSPLRGLRLTAPSGLAPQGVLEVVDRRTRAIAERLLDSDLAEPLLDGLPSQAAELTVVIPVKDRPESLHRTLTALGNAVRVIVVDDGSDDAAAVAQVAVRLGADLVRLPNNRGPAAARNRGMERVMTSHVAFVDSDVEVSTDDLLTLVRHLADDRVALIAPRVRGFVTSASPTWIERYDATASSLDLGSRGGLVRPGSIVSYVPSACMVGRLDVLKGAFDESRRVGEDVDLVWRLVEDGHQVRYDPSVVAVHAARSQWREWASRKFAYGTSAASLGARHGSAVAPAVLTPASALAAWGLLQRRAWSVPLAVVVSAPAYRRLHRQLPNDDVLPAVLLSRGVWGAVRQESALLLRHWWPLTALVCWRSRGLRRVVVSAMVLDSTRAWLDEPGQSVLGAVAGRRIDDWVYGAGVWFGCIRSRTLVPLRPIARLRLQRRS